MTTWTCSGTDRAAGAALISVVVLMVTASPAVAAPGDSWPELRDFLGGCDGTADEPATVALTTDIDSRGEALSVACVAEVDLAGHDLTVRNVVINSAQQLTVDDTATGGSLIADASRTYGAGIRTTDATLIVADGAVTVTGGLFGAGIGGGFQGSGGTVTVNGGTVTATGGAGGQVFPGVLPPVFIALPGGAGIGGGLFGSGGVVEVGVGAVVTATGGHTAIGAGADGRGFGSLLVEGTLAVPSGNLRIPDSTSGDPEITVTADGEIVGGQSDPTAGAQFLGDGQVDNGGVIALSTDRVLAGDVAVLDHHYQVAFDPDGGTPDPGDVVVFAPSFDTGHRDLPDDPSRDTDPFLGWTTQPTADDPGELFAAATVLPGSSSDGSPVEVALVARWGPPGIDTGLPDDTATITAGEATTFTPQVTDGDGHPFPTDPADWTISDADGTVEASIDPADGEITMSSTTADTHELALTVRVGDETATTTILLVVQPGPPVVLDLDTPATTVDQGETITITVTGSDQFGNPTGDLTDQTTFTSDVATDVIVGNHITFPTASPHTITATHSSGATATTTIDVTPAPTLAPPTAAPAPTPTQTDAPQPPPALPKAGTGALALAATALLAIAVGATLTSRARPGHRRWRLPW